MFHLQNQITKQIIPNNANNKIKHTKKYVIYLKI